MKHCTDYEISERLWDKGLRIESEKLHIGLIHAPIAEEWLEVLPATISPSSCEFCLEIGKNYNDYNVAYRYYGLGTDTLYYIYDIKLSNALALLAEKLFDEGLLELKEK